MLCGKKGMRPHKLKQHDFQPHTCLELGRTSAIGRGNYRPLPSHVQQYHTSRTPKAYLVLACAGEIAKWKEGEARRKGRKEKEKKRATCPTTNTSITSLH